LLAKKVNKFPPENTATIVLSLRFIEVKFAQLFMPTQSPREHPTIIETSKVMKYFLLK
jgi:hypothetical protein